MVSHTDLDYRLTVRFEARAHAHQIFSALKTHAAAALAADRLTGGLVAEHDEEWVRIYVRSVDELQPGQAVIAGALEVENVSAEERAEHRTETGSWEPIELSPLPARDAPLISEHRGQGPWGSEAQSGRVQVHFELTNRHQAETFAGELADAGYDVHQADSFIYIFADDTAEAHQLAKELQERAPADAQVFYEGEGRTIFI